MTETALRPRKTPSQARSAATVGVILEAAARILETGDPSAYTTNGIAGRAGVSIGSLYQYFPSKDAITRELIRRQTAALVEDLARIETGSPGRAPLARLVDVAIDHQLRRPALASVLDREERRLPPDPDLGHVGPRLMTIVGDCLDAAGYPGVRTDIRAAEDIVAIIRALVDAAGARGETDRRPLAGRIHGAVFGYLEERDRGTQ